MHTTYWDRVRRPAFSLLSAVLVAGCAWASASDETGVRDVKAFGAVGSGVADDTAAIQAAIRAVASAGGGTVSLPPGTYRLTSTLTSVPGVSLVGAGTQATTLAVDGPVDAVTIASDYFRVARLRILGSANAGNGIRILGAQFWRIEDLLITGFTSGTQGRGLYIAPSRTTGGAYAGIAYGVVARANRIGLEIATTDGAQNGYRANTNSFIGCSLYDNVAHGIVIDYANNNTFVGVDVEQNGGYGYLVDHTYGLDVFGGWVENNARGGMFLTESAGRVRAVGGRWINTIVGDIERLGNVFLTSTETMLTPDGRLLVASVRARDGLGVGGAAPVPSGLNLPPGGLIQSAGTTVAELHPTRGWDFKQKALSQISAISGTSTPARNLRGSVTLHGATTTAVVSFPAPEVDAAYFVATGVSHGAGALPSGAARVWISERKATGFTLNLEVSPGPARSVTVDWILVR